MAQELASRIHMPSGIRRAGPRSEGADYYSSVSSVSGSAGTVRIASYSSTRTAPGAGSSMMPTFDASTGGCPVCLGGFRIALVGVFDDRFFLAFDAIPLRAARTLDFTFFDAARFAGFLRARVRPVLGRFELFFATRLCALAILASSQQGEL